MSTHTPTHTHTPPKPSFLMTVKVTIPSSLKSQFLSFMRPAFDAVVAERECVYFVLGARGREMGEAVGGKEWVRTRAGVSTGRKGFKREEGGEGEGEVEVEERKEGEEPEEEDAVEVWWSEGWRIEESEESEEAVGADEDEDRHREVKIKGWKEGLAWLMAVSTPISAPYEPSERSGY